MIESLKLKNFTAFSNLEMKFSPGINVIIGENGTGKTHLLKIAYALCLGSTMIHMKPESKDEELKAKLTAKLLRLFMPPDNRLGKMRRHGVAENAEMQANFAPGGNVELSFHTNSKSLNIEDKTDYMNYHSQPIFIPTKEVLSMVSGMHQKEHDQKTVEMIFDDTYIDLAEKLMQQGFSDPKTKIDLDPRLGTIIPNLVNLIGGKYYLEQGGFYFEAGKYEEKPDPERSQSKQAKIYQDSIITRFINTKDPKFTCSMTAEGHKKVGVLHRLLVNGALSPGKSGPLIWDEPESNMNPKLMKMLVQVLLELSRNGQQIILATHDYVLLKWFDLLVDKRKGDQVLFHSLFRDIESGEVKLESANTYQQFNKNAILASFSDLYDSEIDRSLGGK